MASLLGIVVGMIAFGFAADTLGRRLGSIITNVLMLVSAIFLTAASPAPFPAGDDKACNQFFNWIFGAYFCFGVGVGGEYPLSASIASERTMQQAKAAKAGTYTKRGRDVLLTFACQGVGQNIGNLVFFFLTLSCARSGTCENPATVATNYRVAMGISLIFLLGLLPYRLTRTESRQYEQMKKKRAKEGLKTT